MRHVVFADWLVPSPRSAYDLTAWRRDCTFLAGLGVSGVVLGLSARHLTRDREQVRRAVEVAREHGLAVWLMLWCHRRRDRLERDLPRLRSLAEECGAGIILDCERDYILGDATPEDEAELIARLFEGADWAVTSLALCPPALRPLARLAPLVIPQPLSCWESDASVARRRAQARNPSKVRPIRGGAAPELQHRAYASWTAAGARRVELELAAYWLARPGATAAQVLEAQLGACRESGIPRVWWWSLRWLRRSRLVQEAIRGSLL